MPALARGEHERLVVVEHAHDAWQRERVAGERAVDADDGPAMAIGCAAGFETGGGGRREQRGGGRFRGVGGDGDEHLGVLSVPAWFGGARSG